MFDYKVHLYSNTSFESPQFSLLFSPITLIDGTERRIIVLGVKHVYLVCKTMATVATCFTVNQTKGMNVTVVAVF